VSLAGRSAQAGLAGLLGSSVRAGGEGLAVAGQEHGRVQAVQAVEGGQGAGAVMGEAATDQGGPRIAGQAVVCDQRVAGEQQAAVSEQGGQRQVCLFPITLP
jgi:hypothetical protein